MFIRDNIRRLMYMKENGRAQPLGKLSWDFRRGRSQIMMMSKQFRLLSLKTTKVPWCVDVKKFIFT